MGSRRRWGMVAVTCAVVVGSGCCRQVRHYPVPGTSVLLAAVRGRNRAVETLRAKVTADQMTRKGRLKLNVFLLVGLGGRLRMEATVLDNTVAALASDGQAFSSVDFKHRIAYTGPAKACNVARIFNIPLDAEHVALVLLGGIPVLTHDLMTLHWDRCHGREVLLLVNRARGLRQEIRIRRKGSGWRIEGSRIRNRAGKTLIEVQYKKFRHRKGSWIPTWVRYLQPGRKADLLLRYKKIEPGVHFPDAAFRLNLPTGFPKRFLDCTESEGVPFERVQAKDRPAQVREGTTAGATGHVEEDSW